MNRRTFVQSLMAMMSMPANAALPLRAVAAAGPAAVAVPAQARSWAVYLSTLHGECTPRHLQSLLNIGEADARRYVSHLIADGVLKPNPLLQKSVRKLVRPAEADPLNGVEEHLDFNAREETAELDISGDTPTTDRLDAAADVTGDAAEQSEPDAVEPETAEADSQIASEIERQA